MIIKLWGMLLTLLSDMKKENFLYLKMSCQEGNNKLFYLGGICFMIFFWSCSSKYEGWNKENMFSWKYNCDKKVLKEEFGKLDFDSAKYYSDISEDSSGAYFWKKFDTSTLEFRISFYQYDKDTAYVNLHSLNKVYDGITETTDSLTQNKALEWLNKSYFEKIPCRLIRKPDKFLN